MKIKLFLLFFLSASLFEVSSQEKIGLELVIEATGNTDSGCLIFSMDPVNQLKYKRFRELVQKN